MNERTRWVWAALAGSGVLLAACGGAGSAAPPPQAGPARTDAFAWLQGDWAGPENEEHWVAVGPALFGVGFEPKNGVTAFWEVMRIDTTGGAPRLLAMPRGAAGVAFGWTDAEGAKPGATQATFQNMGHDFPKLIEYVRSGSGATARLDARIGGSGWSREQAYPMKAAPPSPAPELEAADRAFAADVQARGLDGWGAAFASDGIMDRPSGAVRGPVAIREAMKPRFAGGGLALRWQPTASSWSSAGDLGFTVGRYEAPGETGSYLTVWSRATPSDPPRIAFDTGVPDPK